MQDSCLSSHKELWNGVGTTLSNEQIAESTWKIALDAPEFARRVASGKFVMLRLCDSNDPVLGRPFAVFDADVETGRVEVVYAVVGKATTKLTRVRPGDPLELWGPLGNGWSVALGEPTPKKLVLVAGGVGNAPFYLLIKERLAAAREQTLAATNGTADAAALSEAQREAASRITFVFGARSAARLNCVDEFRALGVDVRLVTEDGSAGTQGLVTDALPEIIADADAATSRILCCGPHPMMRALAKWSAARGVECWTSLESPMACGLGICFSCVVDWKTDDGTWDYKRTCADGPVFDAARLKWD